MAENHLFGSFILALFMVFFLGMTFSLIALMPTRTQQESALRKRRLVASLEFELAGGNTVENRERLTAFREAFRPTYEALPKNEQGQLGHQAVRYLLHRLFVQKHGWFIKGLDPNGDAFHTLTPDAAPEDWAPAYLVTFLEERMRYRGVNLDDLAALAAALEDLIRQEAITSFGRLHRLMMPDAGVVTRAQADSVLSLYLISFLIGGNFSFTSPEEIQIYQANWSTVYAGWEAAQEWLSGVEKDVLGEAKRQQPSVGNQTTDFAAAARTAVEIGARYASFNAKECLDLKTTLVEKMPKAKAGRVRLGDFYNMSLYSHWRLTEKAEYLDALGALDSTNASDPLIIIANYLGSRPNCLEATNLYAICCRNECEELMGSLEQGIAAPTATPERIVELVEGLSSGTVPATRALSPEMRARLGEMAARHGGSVILHGRLFAQWMHHAFPNECPYPHEAGTVRPLTPEEWMDKEVSTTEDERRRYVEETCEAGGGTEEGFSALPWSHTEELLEPALAAAASPGEAKRSKRSFDPVLLGFIVVGGILFMVFPRLPRLKGRREEQLPA